MPVARRGQGVRAIKVKPTCCEERARQVDASRRAPMIRMDGKVPQSFRADIGPS
jgi:hypothetical protein